MAGSFLRAWSPLQRAASLTLAIACAGLAAIIYVEANAPVGAMPSASPPLAATARQPTDEAAARYSMPPLQTYAAVTERPIFSQSRRPSPQEADDTAGAWSSFVLAGIIIAPNSREALIRHGTPPTMVHIREGQDIEGWVVRSILPDRVVFVGGDTLHELRLTGKPASQATVNTPPRRRGAP